MAIKVQANTGSLYEIVVDPEHSSRFAEAIAAFRAAWAERACSNRPCYWG